MPRGRIVQHKRFSEQRNVEIGHNLQQGEVEIGGGESENRIFLKVEGDNFNPSGASRQLVNIFKKSFSGAWVTWGKIPQYVRDRWFNDFKRLYYWNEDDDGVIRSQFEHVGSVRLSNTMNKAKKEFHKKKTIPKWINEIHRREMMIYWNSDDFKAKSTTNLKNRLSSTHGYGLSLHTGGSIPISEYKRKIVKEKGESPKAPELFLMTHKTKDNKWVDSKSKVVWDKYKKIVKKKLDDASRVQDGEGQEERDDILDEHEISSGNDDDFARCESLISKEQAAHAWIEAVGGGTKGRLYGLGSEGTIIMDEINNKSNFMPTSAPSSSTNPFSSSDFQEAVNQAVQEKLPEITAKLHEQIQAKLQEEMQAAIQAAIESMRSSQPPV